jgi:hypothetical protein
LPRPRGAISSPADGKFLSAISPWCLRVSFACAAAHP